MHINKKRIVLILVIIFLFAVVVSFSTAYIEAAKQHAIIKTDSPATALMIANDPSYAYLLVGNAFYRQMDYVNAIRSYDFGLGINEKSAPLHGNKGLAEFASGQTDLAIADIKMAIEAEPNYALAYYNIALIMHSSGHFEEAMQYQEKALELELSDANKAASRRDLAVMIVDYFRMKENNNDVSPYDLEMLEKAKLLFNEVYHEDNGDAQARINAEIIANIQDYYAVA